MNIILGLLIWILIGCAALASVDNEDQALFKWAKSCPLPLGYELTVMAWPVVLWFWWRNK